jgi:hypothetical protein
MTDVMSFSIIPADVLLTIFVPDMTNHTTIARMSLDVLVDFHLWCRRVRIVLSDIRRLRFFAYIDETPVLRATKSHIVCITGLPIPFWSYVRPNSLFCRFDVD